MTWACSFTIEKVASHCDWRLNDRVAAALRRYPGVYIECEETPDRFIQIVNDCTVSVELDSWTGILYSVACGQSVHEYYASQGLPPPPNSESACMDQVSFLASSIEEWIGRKLTDGQAFDRSSRPLSREMLDGVVEE